MQGRGEKGRARRLSMVEVERALDKLSEQDTLAARGLALYRIAQLYCLASRLYWRVDRSAGSEWPALRQDLLDLASPLPVSAKQRICQRLLRSYFVLKP